MLIPRLALPIALCLLAACGDSAADAPRAGDDAGTGAEDGGGPPPLGADTLGAMCTAGCGADDDRKCSSTTSDCALCLVDPGHVRLTYCSQDCTAQPCPTGWSCEPIKAFGQDQVERACVADPAVCGDGVLQLGEACDGDDPQLGRCEGCMGFVAVCGDGVVQTGEVCDGDDPQLGRCVECMGYAAVCGDGVVQDGEACDGDGPGGYCLDDCRRLEAPRVTLNPILVRTRGVRLNQGNQTFYYGFALSESTRIELPAEGDADGCGRSEILEATASFTRFSFTLCDIDRWGTATWTLAIPRAVETFELAGGLPEPYRPEHTVSARDGSYRLDWGIDEASEISVQTFRAEAPAFSRGRLQVWLEQVDPMASFTRAEARLDASFEILHPPL